MLTQRAYSYKDVDMLLACQTIIENFKAHQPEIVALHSAWANPFITEFETRLNTATQTYLGLDAKRDLKSSTQVVNQVQEVALKDLSFLKVQIEADFIANKVQRDTLLDTLGYKSFWADARRKNQQALTQLLYQYRSGLTRPVKAELKNKGIHESLLNRLTGYADTLKNANVTQETLKGTSKEITEAGTVEFNTIYEQVIAICKVSVKVFANNPQVKSKFVFSQIVKKMSGTRKETPVTTPVAPVAE